MRTFSTLKDLTSAFIRIAYSVVVDFFFQFTLQHSSLSTFFFISFRTWTLVHAHRSTLDCINHSGGIFRYYRRYSVNAFDSRFFNLTSLSKVSYDISKKKPFVEKYSRWIGYAKTVVNFGWFTNQDWNYLRKSLFMFLWLSFCANLLSLININWRNRRWRYQ